MKIYTRYTVSSVLKTGIAVMLLSSFMMLGVDLFRNLDTYITYNVASGDVVILTLLYFPQAVLFTVGPSFLFSVTYFLSMLHANNEIIAVLNSSIKYSDILKPIIITGIAISAFFFLFNEGACIPATSNKQAKLETVTTGHDELENSYNVSISDMTKSYMVYAQSYINSTKTLYDVSFISGQNELRRINAEYAVWDQERSLWVFHEVNVYEDGVVFYESMDVPELEMTPDMFRNLSDDVSSMPLGKAGRYIRQMRMIDIDKYYEMASSYWDRILNCLTPLVMIIIACSMNYRYKKNVLFISIIISVATAVVYYVVRMMTVMMAGQGIIAPAMGTLIPFIVIILLCIISRKLYG